MTLARKAADSGRLPAGAFEELRTRFNVIHAWAIEPYVVPRRTEIVDLSMFTGRTVRLRFLWDTRDGLFQKFEGWFVSGIELVPVRGL